MEPLDVLCRFYILVELPVLGLGLTFEDVPEEFVSDFDIEHAA